MNWENRNWLETTYYISYSNLDTGERNIYRCEASNDRDAQHQFWEWAFEHDIHAMIVDIG